MKEENRKLMLEIVVLLLIALLVIFCKFNQIPQNLAFDEVELAKLALSLDGQPYIAYSELADGHGTPYFYIMLGSFKLFGVTSFAMRLPSAIFGVINILLFYLVLKKVFEKQKGWWISWLPLVLSLTLLSQRWYFNFVRFAFETPFLLLLELVSILFFLYWWQKRDDLKNKPWRWLMVAAVFAGLAYNSYQPGRIFFLLPLSFLLLEKHFKRALLFSLTVLVVIAPMTIAILSKQTRDPRFDQQFFLKNTELTVGEKARFLGRNISETALMFINQGDVSGRHNYPGKPAVNPAIAILMFAGIIIALKNYKDFYNQFFLVWLAIALIPANLTYPWENPNMLRTYTALPAIIYFVGQSVVYLTGKFTKERQGLVFAAIIGIFVLSAIYDLRTYFVYQTSVMPSAFERENNLQRNIEVDKRIEKGKKSR